MNKILKIDYYDNFKCTADKCQLSCCNVWRIHIDKKTYKRYKAVKGNMKLKFNESISIEKNRTSNTYAYFELKENRSCKLMEDDGLCSVHKNLGEGYLCDVCKSYPRNIKIINENIEYGLDTSCPEVCSLGILKNKKLTFNYEEKVYNTKDYINKNLVYDNKDFDLFWNIRSFIIQVLQFNEISLVNRIIMVGFILNKIHECRKGSKDIEEVIKLYSEYITSGEYVKEIDKTESKIEVSIGLLMQIMNSRNKLVEDDNFNDICQNIKRIFNEEIILEGAANKYNEIKDNGWNNWLELNEQIFENYVVNNFYNEFYFDNDKKTIEEIYFKLVISFSILKFLIMGEFVKSNNEISKDRLAKIMAITSRKIDHDNTFVKSLKNLMEESGMNIMAYLTILLKE